MKRPNVTPGNWHLGKRAGAEHGAIYGAKGEEIALPLGFFMEDQEAKANARAIAALPDLLAALEDAYETLKSLHFQAYDGCHESEVAAKAALIKAGYTFDQ